MIDIRFTDGEHHFSVRIGGTDREGEPAVEISSPIHPSALATISLSPKATLHLACAISSAVQRGMKLPEVLKPGHTSVPIATLEELMKDR